MRNKKRPVLEYRVLSIPVNGGGQPFTFILPNRLAVRAERRARRLGRSSLEEHFVRIGQQTITTDEELSLAEFEKDREDWVREFGEDYNNGANGFSIRIEVPPTFAENLLDNLPKDLTLPEFVQNELAKIFETAQRTLRKIPPEVIAIAVTITLLLVSIYDYAA